VDERQDEVMLQELAPAADPSNGGDSENTESVSAESNENEESIELNEIAGEDAPVEAEEAAPAEEEAVEAAPAEEEAEEAAPAEEETVETAPAEEEAVEAAPAEEEAVEAAPAEEEAKDAAPSEEEAKEAAPAEEEAKEAAPSEEEADEDKEVVAPVLPDYPNMNWYIVHTYSGYENRAKQCLLDRVRAEDAEGMFGEVLIPTEEVVEVKGGVKRTRTKKFFPGYMIVQMELTDETWHLVKATQKITGFVGGTARRPRPIPRQEVLRITKQMEGGTDQQVPTQTFEEGAQVRVIDGPFLNFTGSVEEVRPDKQKLRVLVSIFGRATPVELDFTQVEEL
jgi:transcriptional antiterminator NusG